ncbi:deoxyribonuclease V [Flavilitoribacter nigricans]|uniref:Endonuclease V n=1 Tax=Flavilitoribacter nigricans (strain ATCC 23147 / DSM 23189 / NBRC 102662 / NCIMB 1420 / SS-2) TaxID=1122177 RepID=A0A2D0N758_FLAN2|nr:deoxyribonuclease V [Flavilitoribacter nigricans]PHN04238.1 endonuclease V [Flavilitoribacter nigricans DSM 23189 = NBRC 102662]
MNWNLTPAEAIQLQKELKEKIDIRPFPGPIQKIAGADISYNKNDDTIYAGIIVLDYETMEPICRSTIIDKMRFPYIPGLLSFREIPSLYAAWEALEEKPDILAMDGHGINHFRRLGVATHFGLISGQACIGIAKNHLTGTYEEPGPKRGSFSNIIDQGEKIGYVLRSRDQVKPVWVSPGHRVSMEQSLEIALHCSRGLRIPEPTRQAHLMVNELRRGEIEAGVKSF